MPLSTSCQKFLESLGCPQPFGSPSVEEYRNMAKGFASMAGPIEPTISKKSLLTLDWSLLKGVTAEIFCPMGREEEALPTLIFLPGGGFVADLNSHDATLSAMIKHGVDSHVPFKIIKVNTRLAPEYPYPCAEEDAINAVRFFYEQAEKHFILQNKFCIGGDSSGATLAAKVILHYAKDFNDEIIDQINSVLMISPTTTFCDDTGIDCLQKEKEKVNLFPPGLLTYLNDKYLYGNAEHSEGSLKLAQQASPLFCMRACKESAAARMPTHYVMAAEFDGLHSHAFAYHNALQEKRIDSHFTEFPGMIHQSFLATNQDERQGPVLRSNGESDPAQIAVAPLIKTKFRKKLSVN